MTSPVDRALVGGSAAFFALVALAILVRPEAFYATVPGVATSGPFNAHFLRDVGIAYAVLAAALARAFADLTRARSATAFAALYLVGHAALHIATPTAGVLAPAAIALAIAVRFFRRPAIQRIA